MTEVYDARGAIIRLREELKADILRTKAEILAELNGPFQAIDEAFTSLQCELEQLQHKKGKH